MPSDTTHPEIIVRTDINPRPNNTKIYFIVFTIFSNEVIGGIADPASYKVARCLNADCTTRDTTTTYVPRIGVVGIEPNTVPGFPYIESIIAEITLNSVEEIRATWGFVLLRASDSVLQDAAGLDPVNTNGH